MIEPEDFGEAELCRIVERLANSVGGGPPRSPEVVVSPEEWSRVVNDPAFAGHEIMLCSRSVVVVDRHGDRTAWS
jgi:hypothetical protein